MKATVTWWSHDEGPVEIHDAVELDRVVDMVIKSECSEYPTVVVVHANIYLLEIAVGLPESFVQIGPDSGLGPYLVAVFDRNADDNDTFNFYFQGLHHTEIRHRNILPSTLARELARAFVVTGGIPKDIEWEAV